MNRSLALDALRGIAILLMVLSSRIPFGVLPEWMYHAQVPPPLHKFDGTIPGMTWVDLVFPYFLFAMGAAIPLALHSRLEKGEALLSISLSIFKRGALLVFFAIYVMHIRPTVMSAKPGAWEYGLSFVGFMLLFPMLTKLPEKWSPTIRLATRIIGWGGAALVLFLFQAKDGSDASAKRSDIIILVLANVAVTGSFIWIATRKRLDIRIGILAFLFALRLTQSLPGWGQWLWNLSPLPWLGTVYFQQYLFIIIPGTIAGDLLLKFAQTKIRTKTQTPTIAPNRRLWLIAAIGPLLTLLLLILLKERYVINATLLCIAICAVGWLLLKHAETEAEKLLRALFGWGIFWLMLGLAFEPFEGGIKKDRATMSYYFVTSGLAFFTLVSLIIAIDVARIRRGFGLMIATGQNPLVAYAGVQSFLPPILAVTGLGAWIAAYTMSPWAGAARGVLYTWMIAWVGAWCAKRGIFLRT
jgi:predicted acyltransferase